METSTLHSSAAKKILITGHRGYAGSILFEYLMRKGYQVEGIDAMANSQEMPNETTLDFRNLTEEALSEYHTVIHMAGLSVARNQEGRKNDFKKINDVAAIRLAEKCKQAGVLRFIFSSTSGVYGKGGSVAMDETFPPDPASAYSKSKLNAEKGIVQLSEPDFAVLILRNGVFYGYSPRMRRDLVMNVWVEEAVQKGTITLESDGSSWRCFIHVNDFARLTTELIKLPVEEDGYKILNIGAKEGNHQILTIAQKIQELVPKSRLVIQNNAKKDQRSFKLNTQKLTKLLPNFQYEWNISKGISELLEKHSEGRMNPTENQ